MNLTWKKIKPYFIVSAISLIIGAGVFCLVFFLKDQSLMAACNGTSLAGIVLIFLGVISLVNRLGAFDTISFGFRQMGASMFAKDPRSAGNFTDYKEYKNEIRKTRSKGFIAMFCVGVVFMLVYIVLQIILSGKIAK